MKFSDYTNCPLVISPFESFFIKGYRTKLRNNYYVFKNIRAKECATVKVRTGWPE